jgi:hypothetical protein
MSARPPRFQTSIGISLTDVQPLPATLPSDAMVVVIGNVDKMLSADGEDRETDDQHERTLVRWLRSAVTPSHMLVCICSGAIPAGLALQIKKVIHRLFRCNLS